MGLRRTKISPLTKETLEKDAFEWLNIIKYRESGTVIQFQDDCEYYIPPKINNPKTLKKILGSYYRKYLLHHIRLDKKDLFKAIKDVLISFCQQRKIRIKNRLEDLNISEILGLIDKKGLEVGLFISHTKNLFKKSKVQQLFELEHILRTSKNFSVVIFSEIDITHSQYNQLSDKCSSLLTHIIKYPFYSEKDAHQFINYNCALWQMKLPLSTKKEIVKNCSGYLWLIRQALRFLRDHPKARLNEVFSHQLMLKKLEVIWSKFTNKEQEIIKKAANNVLSKADKTSHQYQYLIAIRALKEARKKITLGIPLLRLILEKEEELNQFQIKDNKIFYNKLDLSYQLSPNEIKILTLFIKNKAKVVSRDKIAQKLWGSQWEDKYSDWAIDKAVHRLRKRLQMIGFEKKFLKTYKTKGFGLK